MRSRGIACVASCILALGLLAGCGAPKGAARAPSSDERARAEPAAAAGLEPAEPAPNAPRVSIDVHGALGGEALRRTLLEGTLAEATSAGLEVLRIDAYPASGDRVEVHVTAAAGRHRFTIRTSAEREGDAYRQAPLPRRADAVEPIARALGDLASDAAVLSIEGDDSYALVRTEEGAALCTRAREALSSPECFAFPAEIPLAEDARLSRPSRALAPDASGVGAIRGSFAVASLDGVARAFDLRVDPADPDRLLAREASRCEGVGRPSVHPPEFVLEPTAQRARAPRCRPSHGSTELGLAAMPSLAARFAGVEGGPILVTSIGGARVGVASGVACVAHEGSAHCADLGATEAWPVREERAAPASAVLVAHVPVLGGTTAELHVLRVSDEHLADAALVIARRVSHAQEDGRRASRVNRVLVEWHPYRVLAADCVELLPSTVWQAREIARTGRWSRATHERVPIAGVAYEDRAGRYRRVAGGFARGGCP